MINIRKNHLKKVKINHREQHNYKEDKYMNVENIEPQQFPPYIMMY